MSSDDIVRRVAAEVLKRLEAETPAAEAKAPQGGLGTTAKGKRTLVLLTGGDGRLDDALAELGRLSEMSEAMTVVLSSSALRVVGIPAVRRLAPGAGLFTEGEPEALLEGVQAVYLPNMSLNAASKIAGLVPDSLVCILAVQALLRGIPVSASSGSLLPTGVDPCRLPGGIRARIDKLLGELCAIGVQVDSFESAANAAPTIPPSAIIGTGAVAGSCDRSAKGDCSACGLCVQKTPQAVGALVSFGADRIGAAMGARPVSSELGRLIDHTLLKADATEKEVRKLCEEAREHVFASVCVNPGWVSLAAELLAGSPVKVCTVIGFPLGATTATSKAIETRDAIANGATEIDMVINVGALKSGNDEQVRRDIEAVVDAARGRAIVKVILETALLTREEKIKACLLCKMAGADFVKTSTGFSTGGATVEDIALMRETVGPSMGVKASGGIRDRETAQAMVAAGATRIGASASVSIATGAKDSGKGY